jgi:FkbM family methyltransferase
MLWFNIRYRIKPWKKIDGIDIPVYLKYGYSVLRFINNGEYEKNEISIIKYTLNKDDKVLELGTGIGFVSAYCSKRIGSDRVFTYEGNASMKPFIKKLYRKNQVDPHLTIALLGESNGKNIFYENKDSFLSSSMKKAPNGSRGLKEITEMKLNEVIDKVQPNYLIMDIEGGEYDIFKIIDFKTINKIQFELHPSILSKEQIQFIFERLKKEDFVQDETQVFRNNFFFKKRTAFNQ